MSGTTTNQIINAPENSVYLWMNGDIAYPRTIAMKYNRNDITFMSVYMFFRYQYHGGYCRYIVADHNCVLDFDQIEKIFINNERCKCKTKLILDAKEYLVI